jgi:L-2-hydroxyglutarate oxidase LhgO
MTTAESSRCHTLIIGAGITGITIALELVRQGADDILILEKEDHLGAHASGRNSGVLHAGIYYTPDTMKARFSIDGNRLMKDFCREKALTLKETGKVIVTKRSEELEGLYDLKARADASGARTEIIDSADLKEIEPHAATVEKALYSPNTAVIHPFEVLQAIVEELERSGRAQIQFGARFLGLDGDHTALTSQRKIPFNRFINAAGTHADRIAHMFDLGHAYKILPFKGTYKRLRGSRSDLVRGNIYPVPDLRNPFLGVHFTRTADDQIYIGPSAIPAFGRENYGILDGLGLETPLIAARDAVLLFKNAGFRSAAISEPKMTFRRFVYQEAMKLVPKLELEDIVDADKVGIRAQLVHWPSKQLVTDFVLLQDDRSLHILNAISPAFTCSMAFAQHIVKDYLKH